jgi:hypothetical protein
VAVKLEVVLIAAFLLPVLPWIIRNSNLQGQLTFISTNDGTNLYQGNNPCVADYLLAGWDAQWTDCLAPKPTGLTDIAEATWYRDQALNYLRSNMVAVPRLLIIKFVTLWNPDIMPHAVPPSANLDNNLVLQYEQPSFEVARTVHLFYFTPLLLLGVCGLYLGLRNKLILGPLLIVFISITAAYLIYHPSTRYRSPADPFLFILSAYAVNQILLRVKAHWKLGGTHDNPLAE